jgi:hypothetical protein
MFYKATKQRRMTRKYLLLCNLLSVFLYQALLLILVQALTERKGLQYKFPEFYTSKINCVNV